MSHPTLPGLNIGGAVRATVPDLDALAVPCPRCGSAKGRECQVMVRAWNRIDYLMPSGRRCRTHRARVKHAQAASASEARA